MSNYYRLENDVHVWTNDPDVIVQCENSKREKCLELAGKFYEEIYRFERYRFGSVWDIILPRNECLECLRRES